eukprot:jgi/Tetstr1/437664/TSEL_026331.t1
MVHLEGDFEAGSMCSAIGQCRSLHGAIKTLQTMDPPDLYQYADDIGVPIELISQTRAIGRLPVLTYGSGGIETPADAALMMQMGMDGVIIDSRGTENNEQL